MMYKIAIIGTGYVGLVTGACLADLGFEVICVDNSISKIEGLVNGIIPIYEPDLANLVEKNHQAGRLTFTTDLKFGVEKAEVILIAVDTPSQPDGSVDLETIKSATRDIAKYMNANKTIVVKSTVPVGTGQLLKKIISQNQIESHSFTIVSNPEFLREGTAVYDFLHPDRVIIGFESETALQTMKNIYQHFRISKIPILFTDIETAEMIKYASNAFLAMKVTFINEMAAICEQVGADIIDVARGMGMDDRIGPEFLNPGPGYGGSCFPKDTNALANLGKKHGLIMTLVEATIEANERHKQRMLSIIETHMNGLNNKTIGVLGLAFKAGTDDMREAPSLTIISELNEKGAKIKAYDPHAMQQAKLQLSDINNISYCQNEYQAALNVDALLILTEWDQFRYLDLKRLETVMNVPRIFDFRNIYDPFIIRNMGFEYFSLGRK
ncbi:MAG: UDP-glucose/GDP-mannose dehydrogenase family protein [Syntrophomonas sp.]|nr:UDP-glucose/GDP-mannose dehydrogenase family protein [Syntrophomonas sp.]